MITILSQPTSSLLSAGNDSYYVISGSNVFAPNVFDYQYRADVYVNGTLSATLKSFPDTQFQYGVFNLRNIIQNFVSYDFPFTDSTASLFTTGSHSTCQVQLQFGEQFTNVTGGFTQNLSVVSSSNFNYFNGSLNYTDQILNNLNDYVQTPTAGLNKKFLSSGSNAMKTYNNLRNHLYYFNSSSAACFVNVNTFDVNNNSVGSYSIPNNFSSSIGVQIVACGYPSFANYSGSFVKNSGNNSIINPSVASYTVQLANSSKQGISETYTFTVADNSGRWQPYIINCYFLNDRGGFEAYQFQRKNQQSLSKSTTSYKKIPGKLQSNGQFKLNTYDRQDTNYFTALENSIELYSDWISDIESLALLKNLFGSPVIYLEDVNGVIQSANVSDKNYQIFNRVIKKQNQIKFTMNLSGTDYRQAL